MGKNENLGFYLVNYAKNTVKLTNFSVLVLKEDVSKGVFLLQNIIHLIFICGTFRSFGLILKSHDFLTKYSQTLVAKSEKLSDFKPSKRVLVCEKSCQTACWHKVWSLYENNMK